MERTIANPDMHSPQLPEAVMSSLAGAVSATYDRLAEKMRQEESTAPAGFNRSQLHYIGVCKTFNDLLLPAIRKVDGVTDAVIYEYLPNQERRDGLQAHRFIVFKYDGKAYLLDGTWQQMFVEGAPPRNAPKAMLLPFSAKEINHYLYNFPELYLEAKQLEIALTE